MENFISKTFLRIFKPLRALNNSISDFEPGLLTILFPRRAKILFKCFHENFLQETRFVLSPISSQSDGTFSALHNGV